MAPIPFLGRLGIAEYIALVGSFFLVGLEAIIRILTLALPSTIIHLFYRASRRLFNRFTSPAAKKSESKKSDISTKLRNASDFVDLCAAFGYTAEEHIVQTGDGYLLGLHRLAYRKGEEDEKVNHGKNSVRKSVVYMHHGLLMNSEVWVCLTDEERCLPFQLVEKGYDVWLGNNRGNKYSKKSVNHSPTDVPFWDFSMDEFAFHDIPDSIAYILETTSAPSLSYVGFSQGTAQAFATLAVHPRLNDQVNVFVALAPAMAPAGLSNGIVDALVKASPQVLFLLFGRRSILSSATMWQSILYPPIFVRVIDMGLSFLFGWHARNISTSQKLAAYPHLYSFTSTKSVVHWFQIIRTKSFQMYDDDVQPVVSLSTVSKYTKVARFPTRNIKTPIVLLYGGSDSLVDINVMKRELPSHTVAIEVPHYEHLDFLWAREVDTLVFPHVFDALESFCDAEHSKEEYERYRSARHASIAATRRLTLPSNYLTGHNHSGEDSPSTYASVAGAFPSSDSDALVIARNGNANGAEPSLPSPNMRKRARIQSSYDDSSEGGNSPINNRHIKTISVDDDIAVNGNVSDKEIERRKDGASTRGSPTVGKARGMRSSSIGSNISFADNAKGSGIRGISLGVGKAISAVSKGESLGSVGGGLTMSSDEGGPAGKKKRGR
ncbi:cholesterol esterase [Cadophora gregata]|uniref:cholesterol esterase n=1 Tax=Cadophora gregata TaxID=51156 RepID=UPI0026DD07E2|nr:cholesterol esterase [Cadophora gregata]KAK0105081.1 cholesterol esterase [Cadophora gregata f. sp. sojae]KAK0106050.1 cholesterol esterase [Cadophora gregata]